MKTPDEQVEEVLYKIEDKLDGLTGAERTYIRNLLTDLWSDAHNYDPEDGGEE